MNNLVVFVSGSGSNLQAIIDNIENGKLDARVTGVISDKEGVKALDRAQKHGIPYQILSSSTFSDYGRYTKALLNQLKEWAPELIVLAGYLSKVPTEVIRCYDRRIINIHPALLPKYGGKGFYGLKVHKAVLEAGESESGCSVHIVTEKYDEGPVLKQRTVKVHPDDTPETLARRVLEQEHQLLTEVIAEQLAKLESSNTSN